MPLDLTTIPDGLFTTPPAPNCHMRVLFTTGAWLDVDKAWTLEESLQRVRATGLSVVNVFHIISREDFLASGVKRCEETTCARWFWKRKDEQASNFTRRKYCTQKCRRKAIQRAFGKRFEHG